MKWGILLALVIPIHTVLSDPLVVRVSGEVTQSRYALTAFTVAGILLSIFLVARWEKLSPRVTSTILMVLVPAFPLAIARAGWSIHANLVDPLSIDKPVVPALPVNPESPRILWVVFDEWDNELAFRSRPPDLRLPELDRFRQQALDAGNAYPPGRHTIISAPSLITGKTFTESTRKGASEIMESYDPAKPPSPLSEQPTIFGDVRREGYNLGIVAWYLPYSRMFGVFTRYPGAGSVRPVPTVPGLMVATARHQFSLFPLMRALGIARTPDSEPQTHTDGYSYQLSETLRTLRDSSLNFVFLHLGIPHPPFIYDHKKQEFSIGPGASYEGNLALVDRTVGDIRRTLEQEGRWDNTTILLTSDHPLRVGAKRITPLVLPAYVHQSETVPFFLKLAGQKQGLEYTRPIQTVVTKDLLLDILHRKVTTPEQAAAWLDTHPPRQ
ncbi:MAG: sulfatase-like hydrolase/transferase [Candidatus Solibacter sp.]